MTESVIFFSEYKNFAAKSTRMFQIRIFNLGQVSIQRFDVDFVTVILIFIALVDSGK